MAVRCPKCRRSDQLIPLPDLFLEINATLSLPEERLDQLMLPPLPRPIRARRAAMIMATLMGIVFIIGLSVFFLSYRRINTGNIAVNGFCLSSLMLLGPLFYWPQFRSSLNKKVLDRQTEIEAWASVQRRWEGMLYCRRDELVFDPVSGVGCDPGQFRAFLIDIATQF
ncbi:MAG: hypothetical protein JXA97_05835 [Anaerolineales bacterium]|nr:hypothetical protein [Anaerolineales bacterium]